MKRLILCLLLALCLTACAARQEHTTPEPAQSDTTVEASASAQDTEVPEDLPTGETPDEELESQSAEDEAEADEEITLAPGEVPDEDMEPQPVDEDAETGAEVPLAPGEVPDEDMEPQPVDEDAELGEELPLAPGEVPDEEMEPQLLTGGITADEYDSFGVTVPGVADKVKDFRPFSETMQSDFLGTWYDPELGEAIRLTEDGAYVYIPYLDCFGDELYRWELVDRSESGKCPKLAIYCFEGGPLAYYVAGNAGDYFWCISQGQVFYRQ